LSTAFANALLAKGLLKVPPEPDLTTIEINQLVELDIFEWTKAHE
jgi:hypothetical protein